MPPGRKIPDRWIPYKACGDVIEGTRFICFKVPLHKNVQKRVPAIKEIWDIPAVLSKIPKLGAVIDLTNTGRYYDPNDFQAANVLHKKILMPGREIPPEEKVREFMNMVDEFLGKDREALIGVHCTHGLNRTGYMVCRYMRDRMNIPATDAIKRFERARGYTIERNIYIADLFNKKLPPPDFDWNDKQADGQTNKNESQRNTNETQTSTNSDKSRKRNRKKRNKNKKNGNEPKPKKRKIQLSVDRD